MGKTKFVKSKYIGIVEIDFLDNYDEVTEKMSYSEAKKNFLSGINNRLKEFLKENIDGDVKLTQKYVGAFIVDGESE